MPRLANKHSNAELATFADFSGGLNLTRSPESIANNEVYEAVNFEYARETGSLKVRGGLEMVYEFPGGVTDIIYTPDENEILLRVGDDIHRLRIASRTDEVIGTVGGDKRASSELWGDDKVLMTFGGMLYIYDGASVTAVQSEGAPEAAEMIFVRSGRVWLFETGTDILRASAVGDPAGWTDDSEDDSTAKSIQIGYKDGGNIKAAAPIVGDVMVFKSPDGQPEFGQIYRLSGNYPDWSVAHYSRGSAAWNANSAANAGNDIIFLTREGMASLSTVTEYGDFKLGWAGAKVNPKLALSLSEKCSLCNLAGSGQAWVLDGLSNDVWVYFYSMPSSPWLTFRFQGPVSAAVTAGSETYLAIGSRLYHMSEAFADDDGVKIDARLKPRAITRRNQTLLKRITAKFDSSSTAEVRVRIEDLELVVKFDGDGDIACLDDDIAYFDNDPLVPRLASSVIRHRCNIRRWEIAPEIIVLNGSFGMSFLELEITEV